MGDQVQFIYHIQPPGIGTGKLVIYDKSITFDISNISNPLYDLLKGLVVMVHEPRHLWDEENVCWIDWFHDTSCYKWVLSTLDGKKLSIKVTASDDIFDDSSAKTILESSCDFMVFCNAIVKELDIFIKELGLLNYQQIWQKDEFPLTYFLILKKYLIENGLWSPGKIDDSNLDEEINILNA